MNLREDRRRFWTKEPALVRLESIVKVLTGVVVFTIALVILANPSGGSGAGKGHGMAAGFPILLGVLLMDAASGITRRRTAYHGTVIWAVLGPPFAFMAVLLFKSIDWRTFEPWMLALLGPGAVCIVATLLLPLLGFGGMRRLRERRIRWMQVRVLRTHGYGGDG